MPGQAAPIFDPTPLTRRSMGDPAHQVELLALFEAEVERLLGQIESAADAAVRLDRLHAMVGLSRNIGALHLAQVARSLETQIGEEAPDLQALRTAIAETLAFLHRAVA
jgi:HPt (histidine-containing phosphotransfer) domain-containing protein